jgi:ATP-dependent DNA ligase
MSGAAAPYDALIAPASQAIACLSQTFREEPLALRRVSQAEKGIMMRSEWLHEIKHDGFRIIARKKGAQVKGAVTNG